MEANLAKRKTMDSKSSPSLPGKTNLTVSTNKITGGGESSINNTAKRQSRGRDLLDDSSSVASMASSKTSTHKCYACSEPETLPSKKLFKCPGCRARFHMYCHKPPIFDSTGFICGRCKQKNSENPVSSASTPVPFTAPPRINAAEMPKEYDSLKGGRLCSMLNCKNIVHLGQAPQGVDVFCKQHEIQNKFSRALAGPVAPKPPTGPRPIRKNKLYSMKPDDKALLKRKREVSKKASTHEKYEASLRGDILEKGTQAIKNDSLSSPARPSKRTTEQNQRHMTAMNAPKTVDRGLEDDFNGSLGSASMATSPITDLSSKFGSSYLRPDSARRTPLSVASPEYEPPPPGMFDLDVDVWGHEEDDDESPGSQIAQQLRATALQLDADDSTHQCKIDDIKAKHPTLGDRETRQVLDEANGSIIEAEKLLGLDQRTEPAQYRHFTSDSESNQFPDLPEVASSDVSARLVERQDKSPATNIRESDMQRLIEQSEVVAAMLQQQTELEDRGEADIQPQPLADTNSNIITVQQPWKHFVELPDIPQLDTNIDSSQSDGFMTDKECFDFAHEAFSEEAATPGPPPLVSPEIPSSTDTKEALDNDAMQLDLDSLSEHPPAPVPEQEQEQEFELDLSSPNPEPRFGEGLRSADFDPSELDSMLALKSQPSTRQPSKEEILNTQIWAHVDPRKIWTKELPDSWLEEKRKEINARGGRKANYGKVITAQNRKERMEKGWNIHQSTPNRPETAERQACLKFMEDLTGLKDMINMVPKVVNGVLCLVDPPGEEYALQPDGRSRKRVPRCYPAV